MGLFRKLTDSSFKKGKDGNMLFYPWGIFGKGYILKNKDQEENIRRFVVRYYVGFLIPLFLIGLTVGWGFGFILLPFALLIWIRRAKVFTSGLMASSEKLTIKENLRKFGGGDS